MAVTITFLGDGAAAETTWGPLVLPLREPVSVDPAAAANAPSRAILEHIIKKASRNRFFKVEEVVKGKKAETVQATSAKDEAPSKPAEIKDENGNGVDDDIEKLPWFSLKKLVKDQTGHDPKDKADALAILKAAKAGA